MTNEMILWLIIGFGIPGLFAAALLFLPHRIVQLQGKFYRRIYKDFLNLPDEEVDRKFRLPSDQLMMGRRSDFIKFAPEAPQRYQTLIASYRTVGKILASLLIFAAILLVFAAWNGAFN